MLLSIENPENPFVGDHSKLGGHAAKGKEASKF